MTAARLHQEARILSHLPRVKTLAARLAARTGGSVAADELLSAGTVGLVEAAARFDASKGVPFDAFVRGRVHGAMLDVMRSGDHLGRRARRADREATGAEQALRSDAASPTDGELLEARGGTPRALSHRLAVVRLEEAGQLASERPTPLDDAERGQELSRMRGAIEGLRPRERLILSLYYERDLTYREIGVVLGVSESRVCQVLRGVQARLRQQLGRR